MSASLGSLDILVRVRVINSHQVLETLHNPQGFKGDKFVTIVTGSSCWSRWRQNCMGGIYGLRENSYAPYCTIVMVTTAQSELGAQWCHYWNQSDGQSSMIPLHMSASLGSLEILVRVKVINSHQVLETLHNQNAPQGFKGDKFGTIVTASSCWSRWHQNCMGGIYGLRKNSYAPYCTIVIVTTAQSELGGPVMSLLEPKRWPEQHDSIRIKSICQRRSVL